MLRGIVTCLLLIVSSQIILAQKIYEQKDPVWKPQKDEVYLQEISTKIETEIPVRSVAFHKGTFYALLGEELYILSNNTMVKAEGIPTGAISLEAEGGELWIISSNGFFRKDKSNWKKISDLQIVDIAMHQGKVHVATSEEIFAVIGDELYTTKPDGGYYNNHLSLMKEDGTQLHVKPVRLGPIDQMQSFAGMLLLRRGAQIVSFDGKKVDRDYVDWGRLPSTNAGEMLRMGSRVFITTDKGLGVLRGAAITSLKGEDGLPIENTTCLAKGFDQDLWIGTKHGAVRMLKDDWHYFGASNWLPGENVNDIAVSEKDVVIATDNGIGIISYEPYTLRKKVDYYERHMDEWGHKREGFIHTLRKKDGEWIRGISDNDGGHVSSYLAAMCFKYAVTKDPKDREEAVKSFNAMLWLERITPIDGFIARAVWCEVDEDEPEMTGSGGWPAKWYDSENGEWKWKGDTSSDEVIGHFYAVSIFHDLVAEGDEKVAAKAHIEKMATNIMENNWRYVDVDGETTRWGRWYPEYLLRDYGYVDKGLNSLEALTFMQSAYGVSGDEKYKKGLEQLIEWQYPKHTIRQKHVFPPENVAPWDDRHAMRSYYTLLRNTDEPELKAVFLRSLERTWEVKRIERTPWYNYTYGAITGNDCEQDESIQTLREWPLDCTKHSYKNSHRDDLIIPEGYKSYERGIPALSPRETTFKSGVGACFTYDGQAEGRAVIEPTLFVREYWMGRYHGFIEAPEVTEKELISVDRNRNVQEGAKPFNGPKIPKLY